MRVLLRYVSLAALAPIAAASADLIGGGLRVDSISQVDDSKAVITLDNGDGGVDQIWVDCIGAAWGYQGSASGALVKADQKSQAVAYLACRDIPYKASITKSPGSWQAPQQARSPAVPSFSAAPEPTDSNPSLPAIKQRATIDECRRTIEKTVRDMGILPIDVMPLINTKIMTTTRICTSDGSLLITCSGPDEQMIITKSPRGADVGCR